jgi:glycosyltransferase involved in cell wall biosynthesis
MKIAQIISSLDARHGGPSRSVRGLAAGLAALGHQVELLTTAIGPQLVDQPAVGLSVHHFSRERPAGLAVSAPLHRHLRTTGYDVIHAHALWQRPLHYAAQAARRQERPLVISPRGMMTAWAWRHRRWKKFLAQHCVHPGAFAAASGWHATSEEEAADIRRLGFRQPVCVAPNGVDLPTASAREDARRFWLGQCPELDGRRVALFFSRFHPKKRIVELIDLWAAQAAPDWLLLVVGIPETYSVAELEHYAQRAGAAGRIRIFDGTTSPPPYAVSSLYLLPTHSENFGLTIAEALAHGLPVLCTDGAPWRRLDEVDAGRCVAWAEYGQALQILLDETPAALRARGNRGQLWMERDFSWAQSAARLAEFYRTLPPGGPRS